MVYLWQSANACAKWTQGQEPAGGYLRLNVADAPGTYTIGSAANAKFDVLSAACQSTIPALIGDASGGTVTLSAAPSGTTGSATGTFSLTFEVQTLTGSFDAAACAVLASLPASLTCSQ